MILWIALREKGTKVCFVRSATSRVSFFGHGLLAWCILSVNDVTYSITLKEGEGVTFVFAVTSRVVWFFLVLKQTRFLLRELCASWCRANKFCYVLCLIFIELFHHIDYQCICRFF